MGNSFGSTAHAGCLGHVLLFEVDKNLSLKSWNAQCEEVFGRRAADVVGGSISNAIPLKNEPGLTKLLCPISR
ncbi:hypothetical protein T484DRAFT_1848273 [Baffinella frigidus]|nr:hypothetical protein T484DRAFT_1848273 [Cryptophyta sp. CCMP2293]